MAVVVNHRSDLSTAYKMSSSQGESISISQTAKSRVYTIIDCSYETSVNKLIKNPEIFVHYNKIKKLKDKYSSVRIIWNTHEKVHNIMYIKYLGTYQSFHKL